MLHSTARDNNDGRLRDAAEVNLSVRLTHIARSTACDHSVRVLRGAQGGGSFADLKTRTLTLDPEHEERIGPFVAAHEGAHLRDTATFEQLRADPRQLAKKLGLLALRNVVEDCAINDRFVREFPNLEDDVRQAYPRGNGKVGILMHPEVKAHAEALGFVPRYARVLSALLQDWSELRHERGFNRPDGEYLEAPYMGDDPEDGEVQKCVQRMLSDFRVAIASKYGPGATGDQMLAAAIRRHILCADVLYPELQKIIESDLNNLLTQRSESDGQAAPDADLKQIPHGLSEGERRRRAKEILAGFDDALRGALKSLFDKGDEAPKAVEAIAAENELERRAEATAIAHVEFERSSKVLRDAMMRNLSPYQRYYLEVVPKVEEIEGRLRDVFIPTMHFRWERNQPNGPRISMIKAMHFEATGEGYRELFERRIDPVRPDIAVAVLVDRSGSMEGEKIESAVRGAIFIKEVLQRIGVRCALIGFSNTQEVLCDFNEDTQEQGTQERIIAGLNVGGGTSDAAALRFATRMLEDFGAKRCSVIVISDAQSGEGATLSPLVREVEKSGIPVLHFGIGGGTTDTIGLYTRSFGGLEPRQSGLDNFFDVFSREVEKLAEELR